MSGKRQFETDCLENDFLLSSEDRAVGLSLIRQCTNVLIVGAVAFSTYAKSYNRLSGYHGNLEATGSSIGYRRLKTLMQDKEEKKVKSFTGLNRTCRLESC